MARAAFAPLFALLFFSTAATTQDACDLEPLRPAVEAFVGALAAGEGTDSAAVVLSHVIAVAPGEDEGNLHACDLAPLAAALNFAPNGDVTVVVDARFESPHVEGGPARLTTSFVLRQTDGRWRVIERVGLRVT